MSIPALLSGCTTVLRAALGTLTGVKAESYAVGPRVIDGSPMGAYKSGMGWYFGVYYAGATLIGGESYACTYSVGIDITRLLPTVQTAKQGEWFLRDGELADMANRVSQLFLSGRGKFRTACNAALVGTWEEGKGQFYEQFHTGNMGKARPEGPEWVLGVASERQTGAIVVLPITVNGLMFRKYLSETWEG